VNPASPVPVYVQLANYVQARIEAGDWRPGHRLPAERDLAAEWGVAYLTVRRMMRELRERGQVVTVPGKGNFIAEITQRLRCHWRARTGTHEARRPNSCNGARLHAACPALAAGPGSVSSSQPGC
jgi:GntR family transcriptional regulator